MHEDEVEPEIPCNCIHVKHYTGYVNTHPQIIFPGLPPITIRLCMDSHVECTRGMIGPQGGSPVTGGPLDNGGSYYEIDWSTAELLGKCPEEDCETSRCPCSMCITVTQRPNWGFTGWQEDLANASSDEEWADALEDASTELLARCGIDFPISCCGSGFAGRSV